MPLEVRPLVERDLPEFLELFTAVAAERLWIATEPGFDAGARLAKWREALRDDRGISLGAFVDAAPAGQLGVFAHEEYGHVIGMFVAAEYRGRGIGTALLEAAFAWARARTIPSLSLLVFPHNERAIALYRKCGFVQTEYYPRDAVRQNGEVWDSILMTKSL